MCGHAIWAGGAQCSSLPAATLGTAPRRIGASVSPQVLLQQTAVHRASKQALNRKTLVNA